MIHLIKQKFIDHFKNIIAKIGENIVLSKLIIVIENSNDVNISTYIHNAYRKNIGKIAVILQSKVADPNDESQN